MKREMSKARQALVDSYIESLGKRNHTMEAGVVYSQKL